MTVAYTKLPGLDQEKLLALVDPILVKHAVDGVELLWRGGSDGQVLLLTIEKPGTKRTGDGITVDICSAISRELSLLLDESEAIAPKYRLEVGSPGVERQLYLADDYRRFIDQDIKVKLKDPLSQSGFEGQFTVRGTLLEFDGDENVVVETDIGEVSFPFKMISNARLVFNWNQSKRSKRRSSSKTKSRSADSPVDNGAKPSTIKTEQ